MIYIYIYIYVVNGIDTSLLFRKEGGFCQIMTVEDKLLRHLPENNRAFTYLGF